MAIQKLSSKNQIVIPKEAREAMKVRGGDSLLVVVRRGVTVIMPKPKSYADALEGLGREIWEGIDPLEYVRQERASWKKRSSRQP